MAETEAFVAVGEEAARGTKESTTVGFIPVETLTLPPPDYMVKKRGQYRGEQTAEGHTEEIRMGEKWDGLSFDMPAYIEAGTVVGMVATLLKHFFGKAVSTVQGGTAAYAHILYPVADPFAAANLGAKALTFNMNATHEGVLKNHPYIGGRVSKLALKQEMGNHLIITPEAMGQKLATPEAGLSSPVWPDENLRLDYNNMALLAGATVTRTGTGPGFTAVPTSTGKEVKCDSVNVELERGMSDKVVSDGTTSPGKTTVGIIGGKVSITIDFRDPSSDFSSVDEFMAWLAASSVTNFLFTWDTGIEADTGYNYMLVLDLPRCRRLGGMPDFPLDDEPTITLEYDLERDATAKYAAAVYFQNTATAV